MDEAVGRVVDEPADRILVDEAVGRLVDEPADRVGTGADVGVFNPLISPTLPEDKESDWSLIPS